MIAQLLPAALILPALIGSTLALGRIIAGGLWQLTTHSLPERVFVWTAIGIVTVSWTGTMLAALDLFRPPIVLGVLLLMASVAWFRRRHTFKDSDSPAVGVLDRPGPAKAVVPTPLSVTILVVFLISAAAALYARPAESFFLMDDSAVYTIGGVLLARTGSLIARPEVFWKATESFVHQFMAIDPFLMTSRHFGPFYQWTAGQTSIEIGFLPLPKVWTALVVWLWGAEYATWATPFFGVMGLVALYGLARRSLGWQAGLASSILLGLSLPQVWFARYPLSEIYTQFFLLTGLYLALLIRQNATAPHLTRWLAFWSALALAALTVLRYEAVLFLVVIAGFLMMGWRRIQSDVATFVRPWLLALAIATFYGLFIAVGLARHYFLAQSLATLTPAKVRLGLIVLLGVGMTASLLWTQRQRLAGLAVHLSTWTLWAHIGLWSACLILIVWQLLSRDLGATLSGWLLQYWTLPGIILSGLGLGWLLWRERRDPRSPELMAPVGLGLLLFIGYGINPAINPVHPWAIRRLVPVVMPVLALGAGALLAAGLEMLKHLPEGSSYRWLKRAIPVGAFVAVLVAQSYNVARVSQPLWAHRELSGFYHQLKAIADQLPPDAILLFDNGQIGERLTQALEFIFDRPALSIRTTPASKTDSEIDRLIEAAHGQGRRVFFVVTNGNLQWWPERWDLASEGARKIETVLLRPVSGQPPVATDIVSRTLWLDFYEVLPVTGKDPAAAWPIALPVGPGSYPYFRTGFDSWTLAADGSAIRWTTGDAHLVAPWPDKTGEAPLDLCLLLRVAGGRPVEGEPARLTVSLEGSNIFSTTLPPGFDVQTLRIRTNDVQDRAEPGLDIALDSNTWSPDNNRTLGVLVHGVELADAVTCGP